jgi:hypothetical protein
MRKTVTETQYKFKATCLHFIFAREVSYAKEWIDGRKILNAYRVTQIHLACTVMTSAWRTVGSAAASCGWENICMTCETTCTANLFLDEFIKNDKFSLKYFVVE